MRKWSMSTMRTRINGCANRQRSEPVKPSSALALSGDNSDDLEHDVFGHADYADALVRLVSEAANGITIGLFGPWGIGKSTVISTFRARKPATTAAVVFDAWRYRDDAFRREFLRDVADQLGHEGFLPRFNARTELRDLDVSLSEPGEAFGWSWRRPIPLLAALSVGGAGLYAVGGRIDTAPKGLTLVGIMGVIAWLTTRLDGLFTLRTRTFSQSRLEDADRFARRFRKLLTSTRAERVVIFFDNLDRLEPEAVTGVLSTIKSFLEPVARQDELGRSTRIFGRRRFAPPVVFVVAADERMLLAELGAKSPGPDDDATYAGEYLRKFFAAKLPIRPLTDGDLRSFVGREIEPVVSYWRAQTRQQKGFSRATSAEPIVDVVAAALQSNPRRIKQFVASLQVAIAMIEARQKSEHLRAADMDLALVAQLVPIQEEFPSVFAELTRNSPLLDALHDAAQNQATSPRADLTPGDDWDRLKPLLLSSYSVSRESARTFLRLKLAAGEKTLLDRDAISNALESGAADQVEQRLDPGSVPDGAAASALELRAERAKDWADHLPTLVAETLAAGRVDAAINVLQVALEVEVLRWHRAALCRALDRAITRVDSRANLWRLDPSRLLDLADDLGPLQRHQLVNALARSYASASGISPERRTILASELARFAEYFDPETRRILKANLSDLDRAATPDYAPLIEALPELISDAVVQNAWTAFSDGMEAANSNGFEHFFSSAFVRVYDAASASGLIPIDDHAARRLVLGFDSASNDDPSFRGKFTDFVRRTLDHAPSVDRNGATLIEQGFQHWLNTCDGPTLLAVASLARWHPVVDLSGAAKLRLAAAIVEVDQTFWGPMRAYSLGVLNELASSVPQTAHVSTAIALLDPEGLARDADLDQLIFAANDWMQHRANVQGVRADLDDGGFSDRRHVSLDEIAIYEIAELQPAGRGDLDEYVADVTFAISGRASEPPEDDNLDGHIENRDVRRAILHVRLRRDPAEQTVLGAILDLDLAPV